MVERMMLWLVEVEYDFVFYGTKSCTYTIGVYSTLELAKEAARLEVEGEFEWEGDGKWDDDSPGYLYEAYGDNMKYDNWKVTDLTIYTVFLDDMPQMIVSSGDDD